MRIQERQRRKTEASNAAAIRCLYDKVQALEATNLVLVISLDKAKDEKARLATEREQARHTAALFKELVDQNNAKDNNSTNEFPTTRHLAVGFGRFGRMLAKLSKDESRLSPEEQAANNTAKTKALAELSKLLLALHQEGVPQEDTSDLMALVLYGALDLNEQQFGKVYDLVQKCKQEAKDKGYTEENPTPEGLAAGKATWAEAKAQIRTLLAPEQSAPLDEIWKDVEFKPGGHFSFSFSFSQQNQ